MAFNAGKKVASFLRNLRLGGFMKLSVNLIAGAFILGCSAGLAGQGTNNPVIPASAPAFTEPQIIETWGWIIARQKDVAGIEISDAELAAFVKGFSANLSGQPAPYDLRKIFPDVERLTKAQREKTCAPRSSGTKPTRRRFSTN